MILESDVERHKAGNSQIDVEEIFWAKVVYDALEVHGDHNISQEWRHCGRGKDHAESSVATLIVPHKVKNHFWKVCVVVVLGEWHYSPD